MMSAFLGILWQEFIVFKRKFFTTTIGAMVSPVLYFIAFGWGMGEGMSVEGKSYIHYIIPGIVALNSMFVSFNTTANSINISRMYYKTFEEYMTAPINMAVYTLGKIIAGALYGIYSASLLLFIVLIFRTGFQLSASFVLIVILNAMVFSSGGFLVGLLINSHGDMAKFTNFIITPMAFLCGTFFPVSKMPTVIKGFIQILPLTHTSQGLRGTWGSSMMIHILVLVLYLIIFITAGIIYCKRVE